MGFLKTGVTEMQVYLTEYGKRMILAQTFNPSQFTINDADVNYLTNMIMSKAVVDISGDYDDNVFALSEYRNIKSSIIRRETTQTTATTAVSVNNVNTAVD